jgi:hypothetical protein
LKCDFFFIFFSNEFSNLEFFIHVHICNKWRPKISNHFYKKTFECYCLITIQTQNFHPILWTCNYIYVNMYFIIKFGLIFLIKKIMLNKFYDLIFSKFNHFVLILCRIHINFFNSMSLIIKKLTPCYIPTCIICIK